MAKTDLSKLNTTYTHSWERGRHIAGSPAAVLLNADVIRKFHAVWRTRETRAVTSLDWTGYDLGMERRLDNLCRRYPELIRIARETYVPREDR